MVCQAGLKIAGRERHDFVSFHYYFVELRTCEIRILGVYARLFALNYSDIYLVIDTGKWKQWC